MGNDKTIDRAREAVADAAQDARDVLDEGLDEARERFEEAAEDLGGRARRTQREIRRRAEKVGDAAKERYDAAVEGLRSGYHKVRKDAGDLAEDVNAYVRENPGKSVMIAAGAGFLLGLLLRGGRRRDDY